MRVAIAGKIVKVRGNRSRSQRDENILLRRRLEAYIPTVWYGLEAHLLKRDLKLTVAT